MSDKRPGNVTQDGAGRRRNASERFVDRQAAPVRAYVIEPVLRTHERAGEHFTRSAAAKLEEAVNLAAAIDLQVVGSGIAMLQQARASTLLGAGKVEELKAVLAACDAELAIVDAALSPVQQRNLERAWRVKVIDRTGLILEIFGARARTREGRLQVELASLNYQKSRLVRSWTHLERQRGGRGGRGFLAGPGETQIESDRRQIQEKIARIEAQLEKVRRTRTLHRAARKRVPYPIVALVGYTNAGKSTLFNKLTQADVFVQDLLFATLDPTLRQIKLPSGRTIILSDTVGFISNLPTHLIAAFRATLEEVLEADVVLHVRDIAHEDSEAQAVDVREVLKTLGVLPREDAKQEQNTHGGRCILEIWNKIDLLSSNEREAMLNHAARLDHVIALSAVSGEGVDRLLEIVDRQLARQVEIYMVRLPSSAGRDIHWLYESCDVLERSESEDGATDLRVRVPQEQFERFHGKFGDKLIERPAL